MILYTSLLILNIIWISIIIIEPVLHKFFPSTISTVCFLLFRLTCHQIPERSYFLFDHQLPVCARCFGVYSGILLGFLLYPFFKKLNDTNIPNPKYIVFFLIPIVIDGTFQTLHFYSTGNIFRTITGIIATAPMAFYVMPLFTQILKKYKKDYFK